MTRLRLAACFVVLVACFVAAGSAHAQQERSTAQELKAKAEKLSPGLGAHSDGHRGGAQDADMTQQISREDIRRGDPSGGGTTRN